MSTTSKAKTCLFFRRDGFCAKGEYCEFSHHISTSVCKNFVVNSYCKFGDSCNFQHVKENKRSGIVSVSRTSNQIVTPKSSGVFTQAVTDDSNVCLNNQFTDSGNYQHNSNNNNSHQTFDMNSFSNEIDLLWGLESQNNIYFYGASAGMNTDSTSTATHVAKESKPKSYAQIATSKIPVTIVEPLSNSVSNSFISSNNNSKTKKEVCKFFLLGNCRFGQTCKNLHSSSADGSMSTPLSTTLTNESGTTPHTITTSVQRAECGICIGFPTNGVYGILNNCECVFCLACVREWRREAGNGVTQSVKHVRLCPLCRRDCHFVIPSVKPLIGTEKEQFVQAYKELMATKPCKYLEDGECPFGTSCFYSHYFTSNDSNNMNGAKSLSAVMNNSITNRMILNSQGESELLSKRKVLLSDMIFNRH